MVGEEAPAAPAGPRAVLVGAPGAGKTTVGTRLAQRWGVGFRDTDADVEAELGRSVADIFIEFGEEYFRAAEARAVAAALAEHRGIVALGGGAVLDAATRALLAGHRVVYLEVGVSDAVRRVGLARDRPLLVEGPRARLTALLKARQPLYAEVAAVVIDTAGRQPDEVADLVAAALAELPAPPVPGASVRIPR
ncbi:MULTISPECIES: shikimate kinase [Frankia]|uniref:Shikimate kinase n=1 Tax=Frankia alni (strain DSM 45986 / CECT 9034 / ACN14a) TaxID=326424 RepID=Q0RF71_FRAAA|nr:MULTISPECIES: shikimate kinase [Frankia]CAJ63879.1 shikimate kinase I [Frankia alni ACN14a]